MGDVPALTRPTISIEGVAVDILGANQARVGILVWLSRHPDSTVTEINQALGLSRMSVVDHIRALVATGAVAGTPAQPTRGQRARYRLVPEVVERELLGLLDQLGLDVSERDLKKPQ